MPIRAQSADGIIHEFPDGTDMGVVDRAMQDYTQSSSQKVATPEPQNKAGIPGSSVVNFLDYPPRAVAADVLAMSKGGGPEQFRKTKDAALEMTEIPETATDKKIGKVLSLPGRGIAGTAEAIGKGVLGEETAKKVGPYAEAVGDVAGLALQGRSLASQARSAYRESVKRLRDAGVELTPGMVAGKAGRSVESMTKTVPGTGLAIAKAEDRTLESYQRATIDQVLMQIGTKLPKDQEMGYPAVKAASEAVSAEYNDIHSHIDFTPDQGFAQDTQAMLPRIAEMPQQMQTQFATIMQSRLIDRVMSNSGQMDGKLTQEVRSELRFEARRFSQSDDPGYQQLGALLNDLNQSIGAAIERQNPAYAKRLKDADRAYAMLVRVEGAAGRRKGSDGKFTPMDVLSAVSQADTSVTHAGGKVAFSHGDAMMQQFANDAQRVMPGVGTSQTSERFMWAHMLLAGAMGVVDPRLLIAAGAGAAAYSPAGVAVGRGLVNAARHAGPAIAPAATPRETEDQQ